MRELIDYAYAYICWVYAYLLGIYAYLLGIYAYLLGMRSWYLFSESGTNFPCVIQNDWKTANFAGLYYPHFTTFRNETLEYY
jgi:hypothetical protein